MLHSQSVSLWGKCTSSAFRLFAVLVAHYCRYTGQVNSNRGGISIYGFATATERHNFPQTDFRGSTVEFLNVMRLRITNLTLKSSSMRERYYSVISARCGGYSLSVKA
jgi:hypothetical protein